MTQSDVVILIICVVCLTATIVNFVQIVREQAKSQKAENDGSFLNRCPFCGGEATVFDRHNPQTGEMEYCGFCMNCGASTKKSENLEVAIKSWNKRAGR